MAMRCYHYGYDRETLINSVSLIIWLCLTILSLNHVCILPLGDHTSKAVNINDISGLSSIEYVPVSYTHLTLPTTPYV